MDEKRFDIERFVDAQKYDYDTALQEIKNGRKNSHWIWYIFPQVIGLGHSYNSNYYGIASTEEAREYLSHPILGERLREITKELLLHRDKLSAVEILGNIDVRKVCSCMTLFDHISPDDIFLDVLKSFYKGRTCERTESTISSW